MHTIAFVFWAALAGLLGQQPASPPGAQASLDYQFFKTRIQPIFVTKRPGHARCVSCHAGPAAARLPLALQALPRGSATWTEEDSRKNFAAVQRVVLAGNLNSTLLLHALAEEAGGDFFHSGGKHFNSQDDPEWQTLKAWVMGQTESSAR